MKNEKLPRGLRIDRGSYVAFLPQPDGPPKRRVVGRVGIITAKWAAQQRAIWLREIALGTYKEKKPKQPQPTVWKVGHLFEPYLVDFKNRGKRDAHRWRLAWKQLSPHFASLAVGDVTTARINEYIAARRGQGRSNATCNREVALLKAMFRFGTRVTPPMVDRVPAFPARLAESNPRQGFVTPEQYQTLARNVTELWLRCLIAVCYRFGLRRSEALHLRVRQIDLLDRWLTLDVGTTKNGKARTIRLTHETFELLAACVRGKSPDDFVFTHEDGSAVRDPRKAWYDLCVRCGLGKLTPVKGKKGEFKRYVGLNLHDFRRSAVRNLVRAGVSEKVAMEISGHKTRSVFDRYDIVDKRDLVRASELLEAADRIDEGPGTKTDTKSDTSARPISQVVDGPVAQLAEQWTLNP